MFFIKVFSACRVNTKGYEPWSQSKHANLI